MFIEEILINLFPLEREKKEEKDKDKTKKEEDYYKVLVGNREWMERNFIEVTKSFKNIFDLNNMNLRSKLLFEMAIIRRIL